jgi:hypothetical protein
MSAPSEAQPTIIELLPARDELLSEIRGVPPRPKNAFLADAKTDPYYGPAIKAHDLLKKMARGLGRLAGIEYPKAVTPELPNITLEHWLDNVVFDAVKAGGDHIIEFGQRFDCSERILHETVRTALIYGAHKAAERSTHERFFVGAAGFYTDSSDTRIGIFFTANGKDHELDDKYCAELYNLEAAAEHGFNVCAALFVSGDAQKDEDSGITPPTLHPCLDCREELATNPIVSNNTLVVCAGRNDKIEMFTPDQLRRYHHEF